MPTPTNNERIVDTRLKNPTMTMREIGERFGLSGERVRQILKRAGQETRHKSPLLCVGCGLKRLRYIGGLCNPCRMQHNWYTCASCEKPVYRRPSLANRSGYITCSRTCRALYYAKTHPGLTHPGLQGLLRASKRRAAITHCKRGHEFTPQNTYLLNGGKWRNCKSCARIREAKASHHRKLMDLRAILSRATSRLLKRLHRRHIPDTSVC